MYQEKEEFKRKLAEKLKKVRPDLVKGEDKQYQGFYSFFKDRYSKDKYTENSYLMSIPERKVQEDFGKMLKNSEQLSKWVGWYVEGGEADKVSQSQDITEVFSGEGRYLGGESKTMPKMFKADIKRGEEQFDVERSVNVNYWYRGNEIVKLWEVFLRKELKEKLRFFTKEGWRETLFGRDGKESEMSQQHELAIVFNGEEPYLNCCGATVIISGEVMGPAYQHKLTEIERLLSDIFQGDICNIIIIIPFNTGYHWELHIARLFAKDRGLIEEFDPFGERKVDQITKINGEWKKTPSDQLHKYVKQQFDSSSCGVITAENGKQFLQSFDPKNFLSKEYPAEEVASVRKQHLKEIDNEVFCKRQLEDKRYVAFGDVDIDARQKHAVFDALDEKISHDERIPNLLRALTVKGVGDGEEESLRKQREKLKELLFEAFSVDAIGEILFKETKFRDKKESLEYKDGVYDLLTEYGERLRGRPIKVSEKSKSKRRNDSLRESIEQTKIIAKALKDVTDPKAKKIDIKLQLTGKQVADALRDLLGSVVQILQNTNEEDCNGSAISIRCMKQIEMLGEERPIIVIHGKLDFVGISVILPTRYNAIRGEVLSNTIPILYYFGRLSVDLQELKRFLKDGNDEVRGVFPQGIDVVDALVFALSKEDNGWWSIIFGIMAVYEGDVSYFDKLYQDDILIGRLKMVLSTYCSSLRKLLTIEQKYKIDSKFFEQLDKQIEEEFKKRRLEIENDIKRLLSTSKEELDERLQEEKEKLDAEKERLEGNIKWYEQRFHKASEALSQFGEMTQSMEYEKLLSGETRDELKSVLEKASDREKNVILKQHHEERKRILEAEIAKLEKVKKQQQEENEKTERAKVAL